MFLEKQGEKLQRIELNEFQAIDSLERAVRSSQTFLAEMETLEPKVFRARVEGLKGQFAEAAKRWDRNEELTVAAYDSETIAKIFGRQEKVGSKLDDIAEQIDELDTADTESWAGLINDGMRESLEHVRDINAKRAVRNERLRAQVENLDPKLADKYKAKIQERAAERRFRFAERFQAKGLEDVSSAIETGQANFKAFARERAEQTAHKIIGSAGRLPTLEVMQDGPRGIENARTLGIASSEIEEFLDNDVERVMRIYTRTLASDTELAKRFGSAGAEREFNGLLDDYNTLKSEVGKIADKAAREKAQAELDAAFRAVKRDLTAVIDRVRHIRGLPKDPAGFANRAYRIVSNLNVLRYMGVVTISSISDAGRTVMKQGLIRAFRDGLIPLITNFKEMKASMEELKLAGGALDAIIHSRAHEMFDVLGEYKPHTKAERALEAMTSKMGLIAGFDYWTSAMKQFNAAVLNARLMDSIRLVATGEGSVREVKKATIWLAQLNIAEDMPERIWKEIIDNGGGGKVNGVWLPQTEKWADFNNVRAYRQALVSETDNTIITPGLERPLLSDANIAMKAIFQFKSFALSSVTKTVIAGLQQHDMAVLNGTLISLAMGAFSYYLWAKVAGGRAEEEMMKASYGDWADEAISRSGLTAIFDTGLQASDRVPLINKQGFGRFGDKRLSRGEGADLIELVAGPSFDLVHKVGDILIGLDEPTEHTLHMARQLVPFQNLIGLRTGFDMVEKAVGLPERRD
jgi:hypothetical protein